MNKKHQYPLFLTALIFVLILSLFNTVVVLADDPPPATDDTSVVVEPVSTEETVAQGETSVEEVVAPLTGDSSAMDESANTEETVAQSETSVEEVLAQVPDGTEIIALNENGQIESLASEEAANIIINGDPMWCPDGALPDESGCSSGYSSFSQLITELETNSAYSGGGTIYIAYDYDSAVAGDAGNNIIFDYGNLSLTNLTLQGGWDFSSNGVVGTSTIELGSGNSLQFLDWGGYGSSGSLTLRDVNVVNSETLLIGDANDATAANVTLDNVNAINNAQYGTYIETTGDVNVLDSTFSNNGYMGLAVLSAGDITIDNFTGNGNREEAAVLDNCAWNGASCDGAGNITINQGDFSSNGLFGFQAHSAGNITITDVTSNGNGWSGSVLGESGSITVSNSTFNDNGMFGIDGSLATGSVTLNNVALCGNGSGPYDGTVMGSYNSCFVSGKKDKSNSTPGVFAVTIPLTTVKLPGALPGNSALVSGISVRLFLNGEEISRASNGVQISFDNLPNDKTFTVFFWNGKEWAKIDSVISEGRVLFTITEAGIYILVTP